MSDLDAFAKRSLYPLTGWLLVFESLLLLVPLFVLGRAINWPQSLDNPAEMMLPLIVQQAVMVRLGYLIYLVYSILFGIIALLIGQVLSQEKSPSLALPLALGFGLMSSLARCLGIIRWLVVMPTLAVLYGKPETSAAARDAIAVIYQALNDYGGSIGEVLGVSLFAALWLALVSLRILNSRIVPRWLGFWGLITATLLAIQLAGLFGVDLGSFNTASVTVLQFWFLAMGITLLRSARLSGGCTHD